MAARTTGAASSKVKSMVPISQMQEMQRQMKQMQETISMLQRQTSQTNVLQAQMQMKAKPTQSTSKRQSTDDTKPLSEREKHTLSQAISSLQHEKLPRVIEIIKERMSDLSEHEQEIEIDINALDTPTLRHLQRYVKSCSKKRKQAQPKERPSPGLPELDLDMNTLEAHAFGTDDHKR